MQIICLHCGALNAPGKVMCATCGKALIQALTPSQSQTPAPYTPPHTQYPPQNPPPSYASPTQPPIGSQATPTYYAPPPSIAPMIITSEDRLWAALSYPFTPIVPVVVLIMDSAKSRPYPRYHAIQALGFAIGYIAIFLFSIVAAIATCGVGFCLPLLAVFVPMFMAIYYTYLASKGSYFEIPWLTQFMIGRGWLIKP